MNARVCSLLLVLLGAPAFAADDVDDAPLGPETVLLGELENEYAPVPFSHAAHAQMAQMWDGCVTCHHRPPDPNAPGAPFDKNNHQDDADKIPACKSCHPVQPDAGNIRVPSLKGAYHRQCLNCHKAWTGENGCAICHQPKNGKGQPTPPTPGDIVGRMHPPIEAPAEVTYTARYQPAAGLHVTFRHDRHVEQYGITCVNCHFRDTCASCHDGNAETPRQKPIKPAMSWAQSHEPCLRCHQNQSCSHCHHQDKEAAPPPFDHLLTGQQLDADHADLTCVKCHRGFDFTAPPTCGNGSCHGEDKIVRYPDDKPGDVFDVASLNLAPAAQTAWASLRPHPRKPDTMRDDAQLAPPHARQPAVQRVARAAADVKPPAMPEARGESCVTAECHVAVKAYDHVHGPIHVNACDACHTLTNEEKHTFAILREGEALCTYCHEFSVAHIDKVHEPVKRGECLGCHNPHGGSTRSLTRGKTIDETCARCHEPTIDAMAFRHTPVKDGQCTACHAPHGSALPDLLDMAGADLCVACHESFGKQLSDVAHVHKAMDEQCTRCHNPHGSDQPLGLTAATPALCFGCHEDMQKRLAGASVKHDTAILADQACLNCHTPHGSDLAALMRELPATLCMTCHDQPIEAPGTGRIIAAVADIDDDTLMKHGPITDGQCGGCHDAHGTSYAYLLTAPYEGSAAVASGGQETFCFQCHDAKLVVQAEGAQTTAFRNGDINLHALHTSGVGEPRNCASCHATHVTTQAKMIAATMRIKQWQAPIGFRQTDTGGSCAPGCHAPLEYDRDAPIAFTDQYKRDATQTPVARVSRRAPVRFEAVDTAGTPVKVPGERMTILIALRPDIEHSARALKPLADILGAQDKADVIAITPGSFPSGDAAPWRVVTDATGELTTKLGIEAWPMVLVIEPDGRELSRFHGAPVSLALRLRGYLNADDDGQAPTVQTITEASHRRIAWYVALADQLRAKGDAARAEQVLAEALKLHPNDATLRAARAAALLDLNEPEQALAALPDDAALLRGKALIRLDRWDEARTLLAALVAENPQLREAHYLMGQVHEHFTDWQQAAEAYRKARE